MAVTISLTQSQALQAMRTFLLGILASGTEVIRADDNRVPEPATPDFVVMTPGTLRRLSTNVRSGEVPYGTNLVNVLTPTDFRVQLDVHGPASTDNANIIASLFRDSYGCDAFTATGFDLQPLYADDPRKVPFINAEDQYEYRWVVDAHLQINPVVTAPQQYAGVVTVQTTPADLGIKARGAVYMPFGSFGKMATGSPLIIGPGQIGSGTIG